MQCENLRVGGLSSGGRLFWIPLAQLVLGGWILLVASARAAPTVTEPCRIVGIPNELQCGSVKRALDPDHPDGPKIDVHFLVVPAIARNKQPDPVLILAGGPGQSAIALAPMVMSRFARIANRRDLVFVDQRGTGKSAPLQCPDESRLPLAQAMDPAGQLQRLEKCRDGLVKLPHGDLRFYTTNIAMQDMDAVRQHLGAPQWNLVGASYGTRAALEYLRLFPDKVRRTVLDGVAPPDMVLPVSFSTDGQAALDAVFLACEREIACSSKFPQLRRQWAEILRDLPRQLTVAHPYSGAPERFTLTRDLLLRVIRSPLYSPPFSAGLPMAIAAASEGRFEGLIGLARAFGSTKSNRIAMGMHFSVICAEDMPRINESKDRIGADFGFTDANLYQQACANWPRGNVPSGFYTVPSAPSPVLVLSGGTDPATPPRHGARVSAALGAKAQHIIVPEAGHGVMAIGCMRDVIHRFISSKNDIAALPQEAGCVSKIPRPGAVVPIAATSTPMEALR